MRCAAALLPIALAARLAAAQTPVPAELERVREEASRLERQLVALEAQQADLGQQRVRLETEIRLAEARVRESEVELRAVAAEEAEAAAAVAASQHQLEAAAGRLRSQLTLLTMLGRSGLAPLVLRASIGGEDLSRRVTVALALARDQKRQHDEIAALTERRAAALGELSRGREDVAASTARLEERSRELAATRARVLADLSRLERERRAGASELAGVREAEARLERLWGVVAGEAEGRGEDLRLLRGGLPWPVQGAVARRFGSHRDPRYGTVTVSHGVAFAAPSGQTVRAIGGGKVAYAQFFKGYGNLVIVQHGGQAFSLYARLAGMLARAGERVAMGDPVGLTGPDEGEGNLYLEIRIGKEAQDPMAWLKPPAK
ncbi:MAG: murein hydrolase activator EnvC family protein [Acidobacteriota bacterium]